MYRAKLLAAPDSCSEIKRNIGARSSIKVAVKGDLSKVFWIFWKETNFKDSHLCLAA
jgi:hypothetical protein